VLVALSPVSGAEIDVEGPKPPCGVNKASSFLYPSTIWKVCGIFCRTRRLTAKVEPNFKSPIVLKVSTEVKANVATPVFTNKRTSLGCPWLRGFDVTSGLILG
jgi:hypothetical protein